MNRCLLSFQHRLKVFLSALTAGVTLTLCAPVTAQTPPPRIPPIAQTAQRGVLMVTAPPEAMLDGQATRLSPGARIHGPNNLLVMSGALVGVVLAVRYTRDPLGLVHEVWILNESELPPPAAPQPLL